MIVLVGTGHVFNLGNNVAEIITRIRPRYVGIELDEIRYRALLARAKSGHKQYGGPWIYSVLSRAQEKIAKKFGGMAGDEMLSSINAARDVGAEVILMDINAMDLISEYWCTVTLRKKVKVFLSAFIGIFTPKRRIEREIEKYTENPEGYIEEFERIDPELKHMLIDRRNTHMAGIIGKYAELGDFVAVMGDGHVSGVEKLLKDSGVSVISIRLKEILDGTWENKLRDVLTTSENKRSTVSVSYSFLATDDA
ncbi:MAG: hypothetical protein DRN20_03630 [Thermoplasmata archaeon]|nr:MAG: hypothetical protein DRN20_03630 [Thermoplasmata archaeon]